MIGPAMTTLPPAVPTVPLRRARAAAPESAARGRAVLRAYPSAVIEAALERVLASATFRRSQRHRHFLRHVVRAALADEEDQLKEVIIGLEVFGRPLATYDPRSDPIVRVEAGRLREKLVRFYADEGIAEAFEIRIPVGGYLPEFAARPPGSQRQAIERSIVVLPFANLSGHPEDGFFAVGLADQLIDTLGRLPTLKVVARTSALEAGGRELPLKSVSKLLGVDHVVEGSIQRSGVRIRCIARYSRARDGVQLWSQRFEESDAALADTFALQDRIAEAVLDAVNASLATSRDGRPRDRLQSRPPATDSTEARDLFERARIVAQQGSIDGYRRAIATLERAVTLDPGFAQAHSQLGAARAYLAPYVFAPTIPSFAKVKEAALRALALDPLDGEAHVLLAVIAHRIEHGWEQAEPLFRHALRIAPSSTLAHTAYSWGLVFNGRNAEAVHHARVALELDPLNITQRAHNARLYSYAGDYRTALAELDEVLALDPGHLYARLVLGIIHLSMGAPDAAMACFDRVAEQVPDHSSAHLHRVCVHGMRGDVERGRRELDALLARLDAQGDGGIGCSSFNVALALGCLGDRDGMLARLEQAARDRDYLFVSTPAHVLFDRYRGDPDFVALLHRHGLALLPR